MQKLETEITLTGRILRQVERGKHVAIYSVHNKAGTVYGWEVIKIKVSPPREVFGREYPEREVYPANEDWGSLAWSYGTSQEADARQAFRYLLRQEQFKER